MGDHRSRKIDCFALVYAEHFLKICRCLRMMASPSNTQGECYFFSLSNVCLIQLFQGCTFWCIAILKVKCVDARVSCFTTGLILFTNFFLLTQQIIQNGAFWVFRPCCNNDKEIRNILCFRVSRNTSINGFKLYRFRVWYVLPMFS